MNRRSFFLSASAGLALAGNRAMAQRSNRGASSILTSELTGGEVDVSGTSFPMVNQHIEAEDGSEHFHFEVEGGQFDIIMFPDELGDPEDYLRSLAEMYFATMPGEIFAEESFDDGNWIAFHFADAGSIGYYESQLNAYPGHHLLITFNSPVEEFAANFEDAQSVLIDGLPPFLFHEESDILALVEEHAESTSTGTTGTSTRTSRSSRTSNTTGNDEDTPRSRTSSGGGDAIEQIRTHREEFLDSYDIFFSVLQVVADDASSAAEVEEGFDELVVIAQGWQEYPDQAADVEFSADQSELEITYLDWADLIGEMGLAFEDIAMGVGSTEDFLGVYEEWTLVDDYLVEQLDALGFRFQRRAKRPGALAKAVQSAQVAA